MDQLRQNLAENLDQYRLGPDEKFQFKCRSCGKCCKNRNDIMLTTRDLYNIARKLGTTIEAVMDTYCESYIGDTSRIPIVRLRPVGKTNSCPLLNGERCLVHDSKPAVCALYPLGRVYAPNKEGTTGFHSDTGVIYIMQPVECGSRNRNNTVKSWLEKFGIPVEDEFFILWNETVVFLAELFRGLYEKNTPSYVLDASWGITFGALYAAYDTGVDVLPQFRENTAKLRQVLLDMTGGEAE
jgi:Fe-S-cluster containining protein